MSDLDQPAKQANTATFESINAQLIKAEQALQTQNRILDMLAELDQDLVRKRAELSKAVTNLKWKTDALDKSKKRTVVALFYGIIGRRKEWQTAVHYAYELALARYEKCTQKIALLESQRKALDQQLSTLANSQESYLAARQQQQAFIVTSYSSKEVDQLVTISHRLQKAQAEAKQINTALLVGQKAKTQLHTFMQRLKNPVHWGEEVLLSNDEGWILPLRFIAEQSAIGKLSARARNVQLILDDFQQKLAKISWQFWPALTVLKPSTHFSTVEQLARGWLYDVQKTQSRLDAKLIQLERFVKDIQQTISHLESQQNQLIDAIWKKENPY